MNGLISGIVTHVVKTSSESQSNPETEDLGLRQLLLICGSDKVAFSSPSVYFTQLWVAGERVGHFLYSVFPL